MSFSVATPEAVTSSFTPPSSLLGLLHSYGDVMTPEQIAEALEYSVGSVRKKISYANSFKQLMDGYLTGPAVLVERQQGASSLW